MANTLADARAMGETAALEEFIPPGGPNVRVETHVHQGYRVPPNYDSMIAKLLVHGATRDEAITTMRGRSGEYDPAVLDALAH